MVYSLSIFLGDQLNPIAYWKGKLDVEFQPQGQHLPAPLAAHPVENFHAHDDQFNIFTQKAVAKLFPVPAVRAKYSCYGSDGVIFLERRFCVNMSLGGIFHAIRSIYHLNKSARHPFLSLAGDYSKSEYLDYGDTPVWGRSKKWKGEVERTYSLALPSMSFCLFEKAFTLSCSFISPFLYNSWEIFLHWP